MIKNFSLITVLLFTSYTHCFADELFEKTAACRMEVKILGPDVLDEDKNCIWLEENKIQVVEQCKSCLADLELIKEASQGYFDY